MKNFADLNCDRVWLGKLSGVMYGLKPMQQYQNYIPLIEGVDLLNYHLQLVCHDLNLMQNCIPLIEAVDKKTHAGKCDFPCQMDSRGYHCGLRSDFDRPGGRLAKIALVAASHIFPYYFFCDCNGQV